MSNATEQHIGTDGYSGTKAAAVVGITYRQLDYWARTDLVRPSLADASGSGTRRMYSYRDLLELRVIKSLLDAGIKLESVRKAFEYLREQVTDDIASAHLVISGTDVLLCDGDALIDLMRRGVITHLAMNGSAAIHDYEMARFGGTSEDVAAGLRDGSFGMAEETGRGLNEAFVRGMADERGMGESVARAIAADATAAHPDRKSVV